MSQQVEEDNRQLSDRQDNSQQDIVAEKEDQEVEQRHSVLLDQQEEVKREPGVNEEVDQNDRIQQQKNVEGDLDIDQKESDSNISNQKQELTKQQDQEKKPTKEETNSISQAPQVISYPLNSPSFRKKSVKNSTGEGFRSSKTLGNEDNKQQGKPFYTSSNFFASSSQQTTVSQFYSASTLRFSSSSISFTKSQRFPSLNASRSTAFSYDLPSQLNSKSTTFGFGQKRIYPISLERNARDFPSPQKYAVHQTSGKNAVSRSFGLSYKFYAKTYIPKIIIKEAEACRDIPGVGSYQIAENIGKEKLKYSISGKGKTLQEMFPSSSPPCNQYNPLESQVKDARFSKTTFGFGNKYDFTKSNKVTPGPGTYIMPSAFDKFSSPKRTFRQRSYFPQVQTKLSQ